MILFRLTTGTKARFNWVPRVKPRDWILNSRRIRPTKGNIKSNLVIQNGPHDYILSWTRNASSLLQPLFVLTVFVSRTFNLSPSVLDSTSRFPSMDLCSELRTKQAVRFLLF